MDKGALDWLLAEGNPAVRYRVRTELLGQAADRGEAREWIFRLLPPGWEETKGLWYTYYLTALAECGLRAGDLSPAQLRPALARLADFDGGCEALLLLRALVMLDCPAAELAQALKLAGEMVLPDGGLLCRRRREKLGYTPKSCYKADLHALLLAAECHKRGLACPYTEGLVAYFARRRVFYRMDSGETLVLDQRPGWRTVDIFSPCEVMRVGLQQVTEAFCALGYGAAPWLAEARDRLRASRDGEGRVLLQGTLGKSYLPKERVGKPSQWATFYALLAEQEAAEESGAALCREGDLALRPLAEGDRPLLQRWLRDPRVLHYWEGENYNATPERIGEHFFGPPEPGFFRLIAEYRDQPVGYVQTYLLDEAGAGEYGYALEGRRVYGLDLFLGEPDLWDQGLGTRLVGLLLGWLETQRQADAAILDPHCDNPRAIHVYEKQGFRKLRLLPRHEEHNGQWVDCVLMERSFASAAETMK